MRMCSVRFRELAYEAEDYGLSWQYIPFSSILLRTFPGCVMVAQEILVLFVRVRILSGEKSMWKRKKKQREVQETKNLLSGKYCEKCVSYRKRNDKYICYRKSFGYDIEARRFGYCSYWRENTIN